MGLGDGIARGMSWGVCGVIGAAYDAVRPAFPPVVRIETTNACNARCTICPHQAMTRPIRVMDQDLCRSILDQCAAGGCNEVHLHNFGEPLLDKHLEERVAYAKQRGIAKVKIFCNGSLMTEARATSLLEAGIDEIKVSFDGASREEFQTIRVPLRFDEVVANLRGLVAVRDRLGSAARIQVACCSTSDKESTMREIDQLVDGFAFGKIHNWTGIEQQQCRGRIRKPCSRVWRTCTVLCDGRVALCCLDYDGRCILGKIDAATSMADVWNGAAYREVRGKHRQGRQSELPLCDGCSKSFMGR